MAHFGQSDDYRRDELIRIIEHSVEKLTLAELEALYYDMTTNMVQQIEIILKPKRRGFHLVTSEILSQLPKLPKIGIVNIFTKHTSCGLSINENADPDVRVDMETIFNRLVPENRPEYEHTLEGADDMPAHAKSTLSGVSITIPITDGRLNLGTWQGIYFCEYRNYGGSRELVVTIIGE